METKKKIMDTAFELFAKKGISFSLSEVAMEVGIKKASIYAHFQNKESLVTEIIEKELKEYFFEINQENDNLEKIFYGVLKYFNNSHIKLLFWKRLLLLPPEAIDDGIIDKVHLLSDHRFEVVKKVIKAEAHRGIIVSGSEDSICLMFFALVHGLLSSELIYHPYNIREHYEKIWKQFMRSIEVKNKHHEEKKC